jgi:hypothetical protein
LTLDVPVAYISHHIACILHRSPEIRGTNEKKVKSNILVRENYMDLKLYNNNQTFYSQASWGRLEMKPHEPKKNRNKTRVKKKGAV